MSRRRTDRKREAKCIAISGDTALCHAVVQAYLCEHFVHLTRQAIFSSTAQRRIVAVAQEEVPKQRIMNERLKDHVHEASRSHVAQATGH